MEDRANQCENLQQKKSLFVMTKWNIKKNMLQLYWSTNDIQNARTITIYDVRFLVRWKDTDQPWEDCDDGEVGDDDDDDDEYYDVDYYDDDYYDDDDWDAVQRGAYKRFTGDWAVANYHFNSPKKRNI